MSRPQEMLQDMQTKMFAHLSIFRHLSVLPTLLRTQAGRKEKEVFYHGVFRLSYNSSYGTVSAASSGGVGRYEADLAPVRSDRGKNSAGRHALYAPLVACALVCHHARPYDQSNAS